MLQPDFGQTMLVSLVWMALFFMAGLHWFWVFGLGGFGVSRRLRRLQVRAAREGAHPEVHGPVVAGNGVTDTFQVDTALET